MKELSIKEKAQRYDEAIEVAQRFYNNSVAITKKGLEDIFPELKESKDDMIRGAIIDFLKDNNLTEWAAWLEKQVPACLNHDDEIMIRQLTEYFTTGKGLQNTNDTVVEWLSDVKRKLEKQGEQKPIIIPKFRVGDYVKDTNYHGEPIYKICDIDSRCYICFAVDEKNLGDRCVMHFSFDNPYIRLVEQKPKWSEEDEKMKSNILDTIKDAINNCDCDDIGTKARFSLEKERNWLKSLKGRVQLQQQEWSKDDELNRQDTIRLLVDAKERYLQTDASIPKCIKWLEKLSSQPHWKPSEEQMMYLSEAIDVVTRAEKFSIVTALEALREQLKKLREG